jgi:general secretion pathway protein J
MGAARAYPGIKRQSREAGFTLVELLVAMTLLAFLSIMLFGGLRFGARSWEAVVKSSAERDQIVATQTFLRDRLSQLTLPGSGRRLLADAENRFNGEARQMEFIAPWLSALSLGGLYRFTLWHEDAGDGQLLLRWRPADADPEALEELSDLAGERVLLDGVTEVNLSYYGAADEDDPSEWHDQWENPAASPRLVRVHLVFADARRVWPDFVVAPKF